MGGEPKYYFDEAAADRVCRFFETQLFHFEGRFAGQPFRLLPWQRKIVRDLFGWKRTTDHTRRYRLAYIEIGRKNGKSIFAAGLALYLLAADKEPGAQIFSAAANTSQASITFDAAKKMVASSPALRKRVSTYRWHLSHAKSQSTYKALSGENVGAHGKNIHGLIVDELHEWTSPGARELWEALTTSMGAREQPLTVCITTAGHGGQPSICQELHDKAARYLSGEDTADDTFYPVIYAAGKDDPWDDETTWRKANPSLGETVSLDYLERESVKAKESPAYQNTFRRLFLCQWTEQATRWLDLELFKSRTTKIDPTAYERQPAYLGLDLSGGINDLSSVALLIPQADKWRIIIKSYMPRIVATKRQREEATTFITWGEKGHLILTDGPTIDYDKIEADIFELASKYQIQEIAYDPYAAGPLTNHLDLAGLTTVPVYQTFLQMGAACKEFERRLISDLIEIDNSPVTLWAAANIEVETDRHGNYRPVKPNAKAKYHGTKRFNNDPIVATIIATARAMLSAATGGNVANSIVRL